MEQMSVYFALVDGKTPNKNLDFMQSSHFVFSYRAKIGEHLQLVLEPYYQRLTGVPVSVRGHASTLNNVNTLFFDDILLNKGNGKNLGVDLTIERFLNKGYYYMLTASIFDSKYTGLDGIERNTRFNRNYVFNLVAGKEWKVRNNNIFSANLRINYLGGKRIEPIDLQSSIEHEEIAYGESDGDIAFTQQHEALPVVSLTLSYRKNKPRYSSVWSLQILNLTGSKEHFKDFYNIKTNTIDSRLEDLVIPNLSYKIEF